MCAEAADFQMVLLEGHRRGVVFYACKKCRVGLKQRLKAQAHSRGTQGKVLTQSVFPF